MNMKVNPKKLLKALYLAFFFLGTLIVLGVSAGFIAGIAILFFGGTVLAVSFSVCIFLLIVYWIYDAL